ncbi:hypothetical protein FRX31_008244 [Thalictrum thalictroides]|uniref:Uncharacterized protein n=1 Tax=Thalictrum thalictroides TaxID=46969 RepID=A0A7J6WYM3_THATH|nr:hypothetical protein FRX31_008244 [Thalictrum thalictroides]
MAAWLEMKDGDPLYMFSKRSVGPSIAYIELEDIKTRLKLAYSLNVRKVQVIQQWTALQFVVRPHGEQCRWLNVLHTWLSH